VVGVDISDVAIALADAYAAATGLDARFIEADVYDLPPDLGDFAWSTQAGA
jgi:2-polyprenyl-3-methyl-5-hydroxy-6-metoxy-1,4-benzoquinol methylase